MNLPFYKIAMQPDVFEAARDGVSSSMALVGVRNIVFASDRNYVFEEVSGTTPTGRYLKVTVNSVEHKRIDELTEEELEANGTPLDTAKEQFDALIERLSDGDLAQKSELRDKAIHLLGNKGIPPKAPHTLQQVTFLMTMQNSDLGPAHENPEWTSPMTVVSFSNAQEISKSEADNITAANKAAHGETARLGVGTT